MTKTGAEKLAINLRVRSWNHRNKDRINARTKERRKTDPDFAAKRRKLSANYDAAHPENVKSRQRTYSRKRLAGGMTVKEVLPLLGINEDTFYHMVSDGTLPRLSKVGACYVLTPSQVLHLTMAVEKCKVKTKGGFIYTDRKRLKTLLHEVWDKDPLSAIDCTNGGDHHDHACHPVSRGNDHRQNDGI